MERKLKQIDLKLSKHAKGIYASYVPSSAALLLNRVSKWLNIKHNKKAIISEDKINIKMNMVQPIQEILVKRICVKYVLRNIIHFPHCPNIAVTNVLLKIDQRNRQRCVLFVIRASKLIGELVKRNIVAQNVTTNQ